VLTGLLIEQHRDSVKAESLVISSKAKLAQQHQQQQAALDSILNIESQASPSDSRMLDNAWRGAEAHHFLMLVQRQLRAGNIDAAFKTSMALADYEDILDVKHIYSLIGNTFIGYFNSICLKYLLFRKEF
jgi:WD repeat-containing protein 35